jgi:UDP-N-acetylglucosamine 2-epimerase (hydrolysing)
MKIIFPCSNRVHLSRQKLLLKELSKKNEVKIVYLSTPAQDMGDVAGSYAVKFNKYIKEYKPDLIIIRGDRFEVLPLVMTARYNNIPIAHIEGFDLSGVIDNQVRYAVSYLSDYHFVTNDDSYRRAMAMGFNNVWNFGSLDCEYALSVHDSFTEKPYILVLYHPIDGEDEAEVIKAAKSFKMPIAGIKSNKDYGRGLYKEEYTPGQFIQILTNASVLVGNSSAGIKEASILGIPTVNIGQRQMNRLRGKNVKDCECNEKDIKYFIQYQLDHGRYGPDYTYYKPNASKLIAEKIREVLG